MMRNSLQLDGHTCEEAGDGLEAVSRIVGIMSEKAQMKYVRSPCHPLFAVPPHPICAVPITLYVQPLSPYMCHPSARNTWY